MEPRILPQLGEEEGDVLRLPSQYRLLVALLALLGRPRRYAQILLVLLVVQRPKKSPCGSHLG